MSELRVVLQNIGLRPVGNKENLVENVADIIRQNNCDFEFFLQYVLDNLKEDALYAIADSILNLSEGQFDSFLDILPSWFIDYFNCDEEESEEIEDEKNYQDQEIWQVECPTIRVRWIGPFNYPNNENAALKRKFGLYLIMENSKLQYIGKTCRSFEKRFTDTNHPIHTVSSAKVWTGKILGSRSKKVLGQAERLLIFKNQPPLNELCIQPPPFGPLTIYSERYERVGNYRNERNHNLLNKTTYEWNGIRCTGGKV